jgi:hypothetical protein
VQIPKQFSEAMACFFESPTRETLRELLRTHLGEFDECDFKAEWPPQLSNIARHILGIANSGGGVIVVGMAEKTDDKSLQPVGLTTVLDKAEFHKGVEKYLPDGLRRSHIPHPVPHFCRHFRRAPGRGRIGSSIRTLFMSYNPLLLHCFALNHNFLQAVRPISAPPR